MSNPFYHVCFLHLCNSLFSLFFRFVPQLSSFLRTLIFKKELTSISLPIVSVCPSYLRDVSLMESITHLANYIRGTGLLRPKAE